jgi:hypothetical protein
MKILDEISAIIRKHNDVLAEKYGVAMREVNNGGGAILICWRLFCAR